MISIFLIHLSTAFIAALVHANPKLSKGKVDLQELYGLRRIANENGEDWKFLQSKRQETSRFSIEEPIQALELIHSRLKSFINQIDFEYEAFNSQASELGKYLESIGFLVVAGDFASDELVSRFIFARNMFQKMKEASVFLNYYQMRGTGPFLMNRIIQFNIALLAFFDSRGLPDSSIPGFVGSLKSYSRILETWSNLFDHIHNFPKASGLRFKTEMKKATNTIGVLIGIVVEDWIHIDESYINDLMKNFSQ